MRLRNQAHGAALYRDEAALETRDDLILSPLDGGGLRLPDETGHEGFVSVLPPPRTATEAESLLGLLAEFRSGIRAGADTDRGATSGPAPRSEDPAHTRGTAGRTQAAVTRSRRLGYL